MADAVGDDELDDILDGALEAFEKTNEAKDVVDGTSVADVGEGAARQSPGEDDDKPQQLSDADRELEDALNSLGQAGLIREGSGVDDRVIEDDMKLVEEFVRGLASSLGTAEGMPQAREGPSIPGVSPEADDTRHAAERFVDSIVGSLLSEDVLKKPMMEMSAAYGKWLQDKAESLSEEEVQRYREQHELIKKICDKYEAKGDSSEIMELLSKIHGSGEPPQEVIKSLDVGGDDGLPRDQAAELDKLAEQCGVQ